MAQFIKSGGKGQPFSNAYLTILKCPFSIAPIYVCSSQGQSFSLAYLRTLR
jgi:hypothetical protein